jgi:hypothetical protein
MWFNDIEIRQLYSSPPHPPGGVAPTREQLALHAYRERRRERQWELLLTSRGFAYGWAAGLGLIGSSLVLLALLGLPEAGTSTMTSAGMNVPP